MHITIPIVILTFPVMFMLVHVIISMFNNAVRNVPGSTATTPTVAPAKPAIDPGTANLLAFVFAAGATATLAMEALGRRRATEAWRVGADGEEQTARKLNRLARDGYRVLHDAKVPGHRGNIDHVVVGPTGVLTIETKNYGGKVRLSRRFLERETVASRNGRRLDGVVDQALREAEVVARIVQSTVPTRELSVQPVVVVHRAQIEFGWSVRPTTRGVRWCSARHLVRVIRRNAGSLRGDEIEVIANALERALIPSAEPAPAATMQQESSVAVDGSDRTCRCGAPMVIRHRRRDGAAFYGCSTFPACHYTQPA